MSYKYLVSVITVTYNCDEYIEKTIQSIRQVKSKEVEFVIVDGKSSDDTVRLVNKYRADVDVFVSEPDNGIFDAMNKGIELSNGQWVVFINAGDQLLSGVFEKIKLSDKRNYGIVYGNTIRRHYVRTYPFIHKIIETGNLPMCHQSTFYNKAVLKEQLFYKLKYKLFGENELFMRIYVSNVPTCYVNCDISYFLGGGISSTISLETRKAKYKYVFYYFGIRGVLLTIALKMGIIKKSRYLLNSDEDIENTVNIIE